MTVSVLALGIYLIRTNPPKDKSTFIGLGKEKYSNEELAHRCEESDYK